MADKLVHDHITGLVPHSTPNIPGPRILPFTGKRRTMNNAECIADDLMKEAKNVSGVVVLYQTSNGEYNVMSDQGDLAAVNLFVDMAKAAYIAREATESLPHNA